jgi:GGDEF domain-containing protein
MGDGESFEAGQGELHGVEFRSVEFRNNGISDSLTGTMAPSTFHENLKREISNAERSKQKLTVLGISVSPINFENRSSYETALIEIAHELRLQLRGGEFFSRISDDGFWIFMRGDELDAEKFFLRLLLPYSEELKHCIVSNNHEQYLDWIRRIDQVHFHNP